MNNKLALLINNNYNDHYIKMIVLGHNSFTIPCSEDTFLDLNSSLSVWLNDNMTVIFFNSAAAMELRDTN